MNRVMVEMHDEDMPRLRVVASKNRVRNKPSAPLVLPASLHKRSPRPELAILGWANRAIRLAGLQK